MFSFDSGQQFRYGKGTEPSPLQQTPLAVQYKTHNKIHICRRLTLGLSYTRLFLFFLFFCRVQGCCEGLRTKVGEWRCCRGPRRGQPISSFKPASTQLILSVCQFKGTLRSIKDLFKALILIGRGLFCHIKGMSEGGTEGKNASGGAGKDSYGEDWQRICGTTSTKI